jgi:autotransporter-associated beta strand protein
MLRFRTAFLALSRGPALLTALFVTALAPVALAQTFVPQGPSPSSGNINLVQSGDGPNGLTGTVSGAIQAIALNPVDANTMYIGAANGGVWATHNGGATWTPVTDKQISLSVAGLALDPTDQSHQKLYAAIGITSNGSIGNQRSGQLPGLLYSPDGGTTWNALSGSTTQGVSLQDKSIVAVAARGSTVLAASAQPWNTGATGGLYRSNDGGATFNDVTPASGQVTSLVSDPTRTNYFYAAVSATNLGQRGIYASDISGNTWTKVLELGANQAAKVATGPGGSVVAAVYDTSVGTGKLVAVYLSQNYGATWKPLGVPNATPGNQAGTNLTVAIDQNNPNIVYLAGDGNAATTLAAFRLTLNPDGSTTTALLTDSGTANNSTVHADSRVFAFDAAGRLLMGGDGGLYARSNPADSSGIWTGLNTSTLQTREIYAIAYDSRSRRLVVAAQDTGIASQNSPGSAGYKAIGSGDGLNAVVNDRSFADYSAVYVSSQQFLGLTRMAVNSAGNVVSSIPFVTGKGQQGVLNFLDSDFTEPDDSGTPNQRLPFSSKIVLNKNDPTRIALGTNYVYTTTDALLVSDDPAPLTNRVAPGTTTGLVNALSYGTRDNVHALLVGADKGLFLATTAGGTLTDLVAYHAIGGPPVSVVFDYSSSARFFAVDSVHLFYTTNSGNSFADYTQKLADLKISRPAAVEFISNNGVNSLLVGGLVTDATAPSPIASVNVDPNNGALSGWMPFGTNLPNALIGQLSYNPAADVLAVGTFGRGAWLLYDVTAYFPTATVLRFGLVDNDSAPDASFLTNGVYATRSLEKVGSGTLTITGTTTYTGSTSVLAGQLVANGNLSSSSGLFVAAGAMLSGTGIVPSTVVSGALAPGNSPGTLTVAGNLTLNSGSSYLIGVARPVASRTNVTGTATLGGTVMAAFQPGVLNQRYTIVSAAGGRVGAFDSSTISGLPGFINGSLGYTPTDAFLNLQSSFAATPGLGGNQLSVARALDTAFNAGPGLGAMPALFGLTPGQIPSSLSILAGDNASVGESVTMAAGSQFAALMANRSATRHAADQTAELAACNTEAPTACDPPSDWSTWATAFGGAQWLNADPVTGSAAAQQNIGGGAFGGDYRAGPQTLVGVAAGLSDSNYSVAATGASGRATGAHFGLYGLQDWRTFYVNAAIAYSRFDGTATRSIAGIGNTETAKSSAVSSQLAGRIEVGRPFDIGQFDAGQFSLTPFAALQPSELWLPGVAESSVTASGAPGVFALSYQPQATTSLPTFLGAQLDAKTEINARPLTGWLRAAWVHEFLTSRSVTAGFTVLPGSSFTVDGARAASDAARFDFGVKYAVGSQTSLFANGNVELSDRGQAIAGTVGLRIAW